MIQVTKLVQSYYFILIIAVKEIASAENTVHNRAYTKYVRLERVPFALQCLRRDVSSRAICEALFALFLLIIRVNLNREAKVSDSDVIVALLLRVEKYVLRLQVSMNDPLPAHKVNR